MSGTWTTMASMTMRSVPVTRPAVGLPGADGNGAIRMLVGLRVTDSVAEPERQCRGHRFSERTAR